VLRELGSAVGEVVVAAGNHDHGLLRGWFERRDSAPLGLESAVGWDPREGLGVLAECLAPARVRVAYPGVWLRDDVYAIHGHYGDRHNTVPIVERLGAGLTVRLAGEPAGGPRRAEDYEAALAPMYAWIDAVAQGGGLRGSGSDGSFQINADVSAAELRRAALSAFTEVLTRLEVPAAHVIFGHTHRAGPLPADDRAEWGRLLNTGSWVYEPGYLGDSPGDSPYRPGFAALVSDDGPPELVNLLDGHA